MGCSSQNERVFISNSLKPDGIAYLAPSQAYYTNKSDVLLEMSSTKATEMSIRLDGNCNLDSSIGWEIYNSSKLIQVIQPGLNTVAVLFRDENHFVTQCSKVKVVLDQEPPLKPSFQSLSERFSLTTSSPKFSYEPSLDLLSGIEAYELRIVNSVTLAPLNEWVVSISEGLGEEALNGILVPGQAYRIEVRAKDRAGNYSASGYSDSFYAGVTPTFKFVALDNSQSDCISSQCFFYPGVYKLRYQLNYPLSDTISVKVRTEDFTALSRLDYFPIEETVSINPGSLFADVYIQVRNSFSYGGTRSFKIKTTSNFNTEANTTSIYLYPTDNNEKIANLTQEAFTEISTHLYTCARNNNKTFCRTSTGNFGSEELALRGVAYSQLQTTAQGYCVLLDSGQVQCLKPNFTDFYTNGANALVNIPDFANVKQFHVSTTGNTICAVHTNGTLRCAGDNTSYLLGSGSTAASSISVLPSQFDTVGVDPELKKVVLGATFACAISVNGSTYCWGRNNVGQLGQNTSVITSSTSPLLISGATSFTNILAGPTHACGYSSTQGLFCWGNVPGANSFTFLPINVSTNTNIISMTGGQSGSCYIENSTGKNQLYCFGYNEAGELLLNSVGRINLPTRASILDPEEPVSVSLSRGTNSSCVVLKSGTAKCFGGVNGASMGRAYKNLSEARIGNSRFSIEPYELYLSRGTYCYRNASQKISCYGHNAFTTTPFNFLYNIEPEVIVSDNVLNYSQSSEEFQCYVSATNKVYCRGDNTYGQLGDGTTALSTTFKPINSLPSNILEVVTGARHTCIRNSSHEVWCWGYNGQGQLGSNVALTSPYISSTPTKVSGLPISTIKKLVAYNYGTCVLFVDGRIFCWGSNYYGNFGNGTSLNSSASPVTINIPDGAKDLYTSEDLYLCAINNIKKVYCWGNNMSGTLGDGTTVDRLVPTEVTTFPPSVEIIEMALTNFAVCARSSAEQIYCWGNNSRGSLATGDTTSYLTPRLVQSITKGAKSIKGQAYGFGGSATATFCSYINADGKNGEVFCWGGGSTRIPGFRTIQGERFLTE